MKKLLIGATVGLTAGYIVYRLYQEGKLEGVCKSMNRYAIKTKRNMKNAIAVSRNQAEYIKDRLEYEYENGKEKLQELSKK